MRQDDVFEEFSMHSKAQSNKESYDDTCDYCLACSGSGEGQYDGGICLTCKGSGVPPKTKREREYE